MDGNEISKNISLLAQGNLSIQHRMHAKGIWFYQKAIEENPFIERFIAANILMANRKMRGQGNAIVVEIIIPIYNALEDMKKCIDSLIENSKEFRYRVLLINDRSDKETTEYLRSMSSNYEQIYIIENESNLGYSKTINRGLRLSSADYVVLLNSDTVVGENWLKNLKTCIDSMKSIGIVGPLSNAATWQSIPYQRGDDGRFFINDIPNGFSVDSFIQWIESNSLKVYPKVKLLNGFCMMLKREVIDKVGYIDVENFPIGYGEETDYCIRARQAGFELAIADDTYVYHSKSKSFGQEKRSILSQQGETSLKNKYGKEEYNGIKDSMRRNDMLNAVRENILAKLKKGEYVK